MKARKIVILPFFLLLFTFTAARIEESNTDIEKENRIPEQESILMIGMVAEVFVPLEIITDVNIKTVVIDDQERNIPFKIELNKEPERKDYYKIKYSEKEIDMDRDGQIDTVIHSSNFANSRVIEDNFITIEGKKISKKGTHSKKIYLTVEVE